MQNKIVQDKRDMAGHFFIYPIYFNPKLTKAQGRKYAINFCKSVSVHDLSQYLLQYRRVNNLNDKQLICFVEQKNHPKSNNMACSKSDLGRLRVEYNLDSCKKKVIEFLKTKLSEKKEDTIKQSKFVRIKKEKKSKNVLY